MPTIFPNWRRSIVDEHCFRVPVEKLNVGALDRFRWHLDLSPFTRVQPITVAKTRANGGADAQAIPAVESYVSVIEQLVHV